MAKLVDTDRVDGHLVEFLISHKLRERGYVILELNYKVGKLEIDIIALDGDVLCFIEVKSRSNPFNLAELDLLITRQQRKHLLLASDSYCQRLRKVKYKTVRFDYILVYIPDKVNPKKITHIKNAFVPTVYDP